MDVLRRRPFDEPIYVEKGRYLVEEIDSVEAALDYMEGRGFEEDDLIAHVTLQALNKSLADRMPIDAARETFLRMLKKKGLLVEPNTALLAPNSIQLTEGRIG